MNRLLLITQLAARPSDWPHRPAHKYQSDHGAQHHSASEGPPLPEFLRLYSTVERCVAPGLLRSIRCTGKDSQAEGVFAVRAGVTTIKD